MITDYGWFTLSGIFGLLTLFGFFRPWYVLWWLSHQNRLRVLGYYGLPTLLFFLIGLLVH